MKANSSNFAYLKRLIKVRTWLVLAAAAFVAYGRWFNQPL
jgi:hypothetical protein